MLPHEQIRTFCHPPPTPTLWWDAERFTVRSTMLPHEQIRSECPVTPPPPCGEMQRGLLSGLWCYDATSWTDQNVLSPPTPTLWWDAERFTVRPTMLPHEQIRTFCHPPPPHPHPVVRCREVYCQVCDATSWTDQNVLSPPTPTLWWDAERFTVRPTMLPHEQIRMSCHPHLPPTTVLGWAVPVNTSLSDWNEEIYQGHCVSGGRSRRTTLGWLTYCTGSLAAVYLEQFDDVSFLCGRTPAHNHCGTLACQLDKLMLVVLKAHLKHQMEDLDNSSGRDILPGPG